MDYIFTIIIPHKNIPNLLQRCLDSIPIRDDLQVIVVDDNSDKDIVDFSNFPGMGMSNVEVYFDKSGLGAGRARNIGLEKTKGKWITFSDADDFFNTENLNNLLDRELDSYDVVSWLCIKLIESREEIYVDFGLERNNPEMLYWMHEPWRKMVRYSFLQEHNIRFQESMVSNDLYFSEQVAYHCTQYLFYNEIIYYWQIREQSLSSKYYGERLKSALDVSIFVNKYLITIGKYKYRDRTWYYLDLLKKESLASFYYYYVKITFLYGFAYIKTFILQMLYYYKKIRKRHLKMR